MGGKREFLRMMFSQWTFTYSSRSGRMCSWLESTPLTGQEASRNFSETKVTLVLTTLDPSTQSAISPT